MCASSVAYKWLGDTRRAAICRDDDLSRWFVYFGRPEIDYSGSPSAVAARFERLASSSRDRSRVPSTASYPGRRRWWHGTPPLTRSLFCLSFPAGSDMVGPTSGWVIPHTDRFQETIDICVYMCGWTCMRLRLYKVWANRGRTISRGGPLRSHLPLDLLPALYFTRHAII